MSVITVALTLFFIMDPVGNIPFVINEMRGVEKERRNFVIFRELCIALFLLFFFLFFGQLLLKHLGISYPTITIAGGIILFLIAIKMIFPPSKADGFAEGHDGEPFIVPLAVPLMVGPSAMSFVMIIANQDPTRMMEWSGAILAAWLANVVILMFSFKSKVLF
jgi:multiple antibiotic resistance protein